MKLVFMGTPDFAVPTLQALIDSNQHDVVAVYSQPPRPAGRGYKETPSPVHQLADEHGIAVHTPKSLKNESIQAQFRCHGADAAIVAAYGLLLPKPILQAYPYGCINVHPSDLPRWRGAAPLQRTIMAGDTDTAMCIMQMDEGLDTGDVLLRQPLKVASDMTTGELHDIMAALGAECVLKTLELIDMLEPARQSECGITYARKITKEEAVIDWSKSASEICNHIRGLNPYPAALTTLFDETIKIYNAMHASISSGATPGTVLDEQLTIACGEGSLRITELQKPGKRRTRAEEFLRGNTIPAGTVLG